MALKRALRLRKSRDFQRVRQQGRSIASRLLILGWTPNREAYTRVGFIVSKRVARHAVDRNTIKRLLSEALRPALADLPPGWDIVINARQQAANSDLRTLQQDILTLLRRAQLLNEQNQETW